MVHKPLHHSNLKPFMSFHVEVLPMKVSFLAVQMIPLLVLVPRTSTHWDQLGETLPSVSCDAQLWQKPNEVLPEIHVLQQALFR